MTEFTKEQKEFMLIAIKLSIANVPKKRGPFGAVVVKDGKIIAKAANRVTVDNDPTAHAEVVAIRKACKVLKSFQLTGCEIYTSCEPCRCVWLPFIGLDLPKYFMPIPNQMRRLLVSMIVLSMMKLEKV